MRERLFYALLPDPDAAAATLRIAERVRADNPVGRWRPIAPARIHVTVQFLATFEAGVPPDIEHAAVAAGAAVTHEAFDAAFTHVDVFRGRRGDLPIVLLGDARGAVARLNAALRAALAAAGIGTYANGPYVPHVTIAYGAPVAAADLEEIVVWRVHELALFKSRDGAPEFERVAAWPLAGG